MNLEAFKKYSTYVESKEIQKEEVWSYTRVSSKEQFTSNGSVQTQKSVAQEFAIQNNYNLTHEFGGTYESAKGDFTRKEFNNMIAEVRKSKTKPYAIMIFKMSRFSRSGSGGIAVVHELVDDMGVHLIETNTGLSTLTPRGKNTILGKLVEAERENIERLEFTMPGMKNFLKTGNWLGPAPFGYDHHGPRVNDYSRLSHKQKIVLNETGKILKKAWQWKIDGKRDYEIVEDLKSLGLSVTKQKLSDMWRKPFYCGVSVHRLLVGEAVDGNWEPMVSKEDFIKVQSIIEKNNVGYTVCKINEERPLTGFVSCKSCGHKLTSYEVKSKGLHYYTCQNKCEGSTMNAHSLEKSKKEGINNLFIQLLGEFQLNEELIDLFKKQLELSIDYINSDDLEQGKSLKKAITSLNEQLEKLEEKYLFQGLPKHTYEKHLNRIQCEMQEKTKQLEKVQNKISNRDEVINKCVSISNNMSKYWASGDINTKLRIQKTIFPSGLVIDAKNRQYLTKEVNAIFERIPDFTGDTEGQKKDAPSNLPDASCLVAGTRLERATFGL
jgi:site-specific DNA recombinase